LEERKSGTSDEAAETLSLLSLLRKQLLDADDSRAIGFAVADAIAAAPVLNELLAWSTYSSTDKEAAVGPTWWLAGCHVYVFCLILLPSWWLTCSDTGWCEKTMFGTRASEENSLVRMNFKTLKIGRPNHRFQTRAATQSWTRSLPGRAGLSDTQNGLNDSE
jgi:hypothetical protein